MNVPSPDMKTDVENALSQAGVTEITVAQDRDKGVITLSGDVNIWLETTSEPETLLVT